MRTAKTTPAEAFLRRRAFYLRISRDTLRVAMNRNRTKPAAPKDPTKVKLLKRPR